jgi:transcriptional regulator with XRE-family HTH domain
VTDPDEFLRALGKRIRILRLTAELTQDDLAARTDMSRSFVSLIEHGAHGIDVVRLLRIAQAFEVRLSELIAEVESKRR